jgi:hypothetical protein
MLAGSRKSVTAHPLMQLPDEASSTLTPVEPVNEPAISRTNTRQAEVWQQTKKFEGKRRENLLLG